MIKRSPSEADLHRNYYRSGYNRFMKCFNCMPSYNHQVLVAQNEHVETKGVNTLSYRLNRMIVPPRVIFPKSQFIYFKHFGTYLNKYSIIDATITGKGNSSKRKTQAKITLKLR